MGGVLSQANWRLWYVDSEETVVWGVANFVAENAFDGNSGTFWMTEWYTSSPPPPHEIQIDLGGNYTIGGFRYLPRQDGSFYGGIANYAFYVSTDGTNWGTAVATGTFPATATEKEVLFPGKPGRFIRLRALSEVNGNPWTSMAELNVLEGAIASYIAIGDSITFGTGDDISADGIGYEPILANSLGTAIANEGVPGVDSAYGASNISSTLSKYPSAKYYLVMYGTNDAYIGTSGGPVSGAAYKSNMQTIISAIKAAGKTPYLAKVPYTTNVFYSIQSIQEYNAVIDVLVAENGITVSPPDFYTLFQDTSLLSADGLHPNGVGYQSMANQWFNALPK